jgi:hypothetical protein
MNREAERHLDKAKEFVRKGDDFYWKAGEEIVAAQKADPTLSNGEIGKWFGKSDKWVGVLVAHVTTSTPESSIDWKRGSHGTKAEQEEVLNKFLFEAPLEVVERKVANLPPERKQAIAAAVGDRYAQARQGHDEAERRLTPAQRKEREAAVGAVDQRVADMTVNFDVLEVANHLDQAKNTLSEMIAFNTITPDGMRHIDTALTAFLDEYRVAQAMAGVEVNE